MAEREFETFQARAAEAVSGDGLESVYVGIVREDGEREYYFGNDTEDVGELREAAATQLGMLLRVLADRSDDSVDEVADLAVERAGELRLE
ncbi:hypothetical protein [Halorarum salinum]|uniref:DUF8113 domain-containing protein n=1 Tax=Halorarum salinum TaxID=2743089 RepID=A0A7D5QDR5_9EURY|nr:hypothetical protein [Halobaculum salinum]QLG63480.1 hypothetical protein HUG12_17805 [Halobaculum salinum]